MGITINVGGYKVLKKASIELSPAILYGPNGSGKSSLMEVVEWVLNPSRATLALEAIRKNFRIELEVNGSTLRIERGDGGYSVLGDYRYQYHDLDSLGLQLRQSLGRLAGESYRSWSDLLHVDPCAVRQASGDSLFDYCEGELNPLEPELWESVQWELRDLVKVSAPLLYEGKWYVKDFEARGAWVPFKHLSYGRRRAASIILASASSRSVFIEAIEAGLHKDLLAGLLRLLNRKAKEGRLVIVETHLGLALAQGLKLGFKAYYLEGGESREVNAESLRHIELFKREVEAYIQ